MAKEAYSGRYDMFEHDKRDAAEAKKKRKKVQAGKNQRERDIDKYMSKKMPTKMPNWREGESTKRKKLSPADKKRMDKLREGPPRPKNQDHKKPRKRIVTVKVDTAEAKRRAGEAAKKIKGAAKKVGSAAKKGYAKAKEWEASERAKAKERKKRRPSNYKPAPRN